MAQSGFTPISLYFSATGAAVPMAANLVAGELALNTNDGKLYYKNSSGVVTLLASATTVTNSFSAGTTGLTPNTATTGAVTLAGTLAVANGGTGLTAGTSGGVLAYTATGTLASSAALAASALVIGGGAGAAPSTTTTGTGVVTALGVNTGTAGAFVVNGGALGSPSSVGTMPAFTLGGTVAGAGNQINNVVIGASSPLAGSFTTLSATGTLSGGTSGTGYSFSGSAPAGSLALDSSGNLGLGVTPSAWGGAVNKAFEVSNVVSLSAQNNALQAYLSTNAYYNGTSWTYKNTGISAQYFFGAVGHQWNTAPSGTAGNPITFTQAMTLDASGRLLVGATATDSGAQFRFQYTGSSQNGLQLFDNTNTAGSLFTIFGYNTGSGNNNVGTIARSGTDNAIIVNGTSYLALGSNGTERARIDSSGNLLVACTTNPSSTVRGVMIGPNGPNGVQLLLANTITGTFANLVQFINGNGQVGSISTSGSLTSYNVSSDYRLKEAIAPMTGALTKVALLKPRTYKWKVDGSDGEGFIAHELAEVCPHAVTGEKDELNADGKPQYQGIDVSFLVATLTAAIQELKAEFDAYKASHP